MNSKQIIYDLKNNFEFLAEVIVYNNPNAVEQKINESYPANFENENAMLDVIFDFASRGEQDFVINALSVPFLTENANTELLIAWNVIQVEAGSGAKFSDWSGGMFQAIGMIGSSVANNNSGGDINLPPEPPRTDYTKFFLLGGIVLILLVIVFVFTRNRGK